MTINFFSMAKVSTRLPGKNTRPMNGRPLYQYTFDFVKQFRYPYTVITNNEEISQSAIVQGFRVIRDSERILALSERDKDVAYAEFLLEELPSDVYVMLPFTSPIRVARNLQRDIDTFIASRFESAYYVWHDDNLTKHALGDAFMFTAKQLAKGSFRDELSLCFPGLYAFNDINTLEDFQECERGMRS